MKDFKITTSGAGLCLLIQGKKFQSNTTIYYAKCPYGNMFRLYWVIIRPSRVQIQCIKMNYKFWYIGSVLWKAWWWTNRVETCCQKNILRNKLLCLSEIYKLCELNKHIGMTNVKLCLLIFTHRLARTSNRLMLEGIRVLYLIQGENNRFKTNVRWNNCGLVWVTTLTFLWRN
jgi:hypothetical protein